ncbi:MAG: TIGR00730 family Rossman fold protein [Geminicoccaceae bacterium]
MKPRICVFCGSRYGREQRYREVAKAFGEALAENGFELIYGGGDVGLMGTLADGALSRSGTVTGFIPERLLAREVGHRGLTRLDITEDMFERKRKMIVGADAFVALPGGLGTVDEILDAVTLRQLGYHDRPIYLLDLDGFWQPFVALVEAIVDAEFAGKTARALFQLKSDIDDIVNQLKGDFAS